MVVVLPPAVWKACAVARQTRWGWSPSGFCMPAISKSLRTLPCCLAAVRCRRLAAGRGAGRLCGSGLGVMRRAAASARDSHQEPDCGAGAAGREGAEGFEQELVSADLGRHWSVSVRAAGEHAVITRRWGKVGGKLQVDERNVSESKNIGWTNERKPMQVANDMAASFAQKKIDSGYRPAAVSGTKAAPGAEMPQVMLARNYSSTALGTFPGAGSDAWTAVIQPKLDGVRCLVRLNLTAPSPPELCTRQRKPLTHLKLLEPGLKKVRSAAARVLQAGPGAGLVPGPLFLDGELYAHGELTFQEVVSAVRRLKEPNHELLGRIRLYVFDCFQLGHDLEFQKRWDLVQDIMRRAGPSVSSVLLVESTLHRGEDLPGAIERELGNRLREGYEGVVVRDPIGVYETRKRSASLLKFKRFDDAEFAVVGWEEGEGTAAGTVVWKCETKDKQVFSVRPMGNVGERRACFQRVQECFEDEFHGKLLTVRYQGLSDDGIPRFPVGVEIRDYE